IQPDDLRLHRHPRVDGHRDHLWTDPVLHRWHTAGHPGGASAHHGRLARVVIRKTGTRAFHGVLAAVLLAGAMAPALPQPAAVSWADIEGRIQYAYYTDDARALNGVLTSLKPKPVEGEDESRAADAGTRAYFRALAHYRLAQVLAASKKSQARDAIDDCGAEVDHAVDTLPIVKFGLDETPEAR